MSFSADEINSDDGIIHLQFNHRISEGTTTVESYGLKLADTIRFPRPIVPRAKKIYQELKISEEFSENVHFILLCFEIFFT